MTTYTWNRFLCPADATSGLTEILPSLHNNLSHTDPETPQPLQILNNHTTLKAGTDQALDSGSK